MRKIILNLAISIDGYISDEQGNFDWIVGQGDTDQGEMFDFDEFLNRVDTLIMGSKSYEDVVLSDLTTFDDKQVFVATNRQLESRSHVRFIQGDICNVVKNMTNEPGKDIWLFGGAGLTDEFIRQGIIDEYIIAVIPTILGNGRRLFKGDYPKLDLKLVDHKVGDGIVVMTYIPR